MELIRVSTNQTEKLPAKPTRSTHVSANAKIVVYIIIVGGGDWRRHETKRNREKRREEKKTTTARKELNESTFCFNK